MTDRLAASGWVTSDATETSTTEVAPDGGTDAHEFTFGPAGSIDKSVSPAPFPLSAQFDVWLRVEAGTADVTLGVYRAGPALVEQELHVIDDVWRRYSLRASHADGIASVRLSCASEVVHVWGETLGEVDDTLECRFETISQSHTVPEYWVIGAYVEPLE